MPEEIWAAFKDGKARSFDTSKRSLLIGYDMIALQGIDVCEQKMIEAGWFFSLANIQETEWGFQHGFAPCVRESFPLRLLQWGAFHPRWEITLRSTIFFYSHPEKAPNVPNDLRAAFSRYGWMDSRDGRRRSTVDKTRAACLYGLEALGIRIVPVIALPKY